jgi:mannose-6-phosphate isomerase-like protein (cupin superfamily)
LKIDFHPITKFPDYKITKFIFVVRGVVLRSHVACGACLSLVLAGALGISAADPPGAEHWTAAALKEFGPALAKKMGPQKVASQQLASFDNHSVLVAHREGDGQAELHRRQVDLIIIQSGEATIRVGGELVGGKEVRPNELLGTSINGGVDKTLGAGDVLRVPAGTPHQMFVRAGQKVTYLAVKIDVPS